MELPIRGIYGKRCTSPIYVLYNKYTNRTAAQSVHNTFMYLLHGEPGQNFKVNGAHHNGTHACYNIGSEMSMLEGKAEREEGTASNREGTRTTVGVREPSERAEHSNLR